MGAVRISMVDMSTVSKFLPKKREFLSEFQAAEEAYLSGMREVLQEVAAKRFLEIVGPRSSNPQVIEASEAAFKAYNSLSEILDDDKRKLLGKIEEAFNFETALLEEEWFVRGFSEGYRFIKEIYKSGGMLQQ
jgi:hypothetical protein